MCSVHMHKQARKYKREECSVVGQENISTGSEWPCAGVGAPEACSRLARVNGSFWKNSFVYSRAGGKEKEGGVRSERMVCV